MCKPSQEGLVGMASARCRNRGAVDGFITKAYKQMVLALGGWNCSRCGAWNNDWLWYCNYCGGQ